MSNSLSISELAMFNTRVNLGSYENSLEEIAPSVFYVSSLHIPDTNCNLGYRRDCAAPSPDQVKVIERTAASKSREPAIWQIADQRIPKGYQVSASRVWMIADTSTKPPLITVLNAKVHINPRLPTADMADVFDDVYCQGKGDVGFNSIAREYVDIFRNIAPDPPSKAFFIGVYIDDVCVAISNVNILGKTAGLYSVAVRQEYRRKGLGRLVATEGIKLAAKEGAKHIILQTAPNSPLQTMYESVGFKSVFVSELLTKVSPKKPGKGQKI